MTIAERAATSGGGPQGAATGGRAEAAGLSTGDSVGTDVERIAGGHGALTEPPLPAPRARYGEPGGRFTPIVRSRGAVPAADAEPLAQPTQNRGVARNVIGGGHCDGKKRKRCKGEGGQGDAEGEKTTEPVCPCRS